MIQTVRATFDGQVLRPEEPLDLEPNTTYVVTIRPVPPIDAPTDTGEYPLTTIRRLATDMGVTDLAENHTWYAFHHGRLSDESSDR